MENDIDREFGQHECSICGTDCSFVSDQLDENRDRIAALESITNRLSDQEIIDILGRPLSADAIRRNRK